MRLRPKGRRTGRTASRATRGWSSWPAAGDAPPAVHPAHHGQRPSKTVLPNRRDAVHAPPHVGPGPTVAPADRNPDGHHGRAGIVSPRCGVRRRPGARPGPACQQGDGTRSAPPVAVDRRAGSLGHGGRCFPRTISSGRRSGSSATWGRRAASRHCAGSLGGPGRRGGRPRTEHGGSPPGALRDRRGRRGAPRPPVGRNPTAQPRCAFSPAVSSGTTFVLVGQLAAFLRAARRALPEVLDALSPTTAFLGTTLRGNDVLAAAYRSLRAGQLLAHAGSPAAPRPADAAHSAPCTGATGATPSEFSGHCGASTAPGVAAGVRSGARTRCGVGVGRFD